MSEIQRRRFLIAAGALLAGHRTAEAQEPGRSYRIKMIGENAQRLRIPFGGLGYGPGDTLSLFIYGSSLLQAYRDAARHVDRILKGARPAELPVEMPTRLFFVVNLRIAQALGLKVPQSVLLRANRVIE